MTFNAGLLNTNLATDVIGQTKMDLATPVNIFNSLQANKRANQQAIATQKLADLTLSTAEKEAKRKEMASKIMQSSLNQNGTINAEKAIAGFNQNGFYDEAMAIHEKMAKVAKDRFEEQQQLKKQETENFTELGKSASAVIDSPNGVEAFMKFREDAMKRGLPISEGLKNYMPVDEELIDGRLDPKVKQELDYYIDRTLTPEQRLAKRKAELEAKDEGGEFGLQPIYGKDKSGKTVAFQAKKTGGLKQVEIPEGIELTPGVQVTNLGDSVGILDKSGNVIAKIDKGKAPGQQDEINIKKEALGIRKEEAERKRVEFAKKTKSYEAKNSSQIKSIERFIDKAKKLKKNENLKYTSGASRYSTSGSEFPIFETKGKDAQADLDFIVSAGIIETMTKLKNESPTGSTGFGALSDKELQTLKDAESTLGNKNTSYEKKKEALGELINIMEDRAIQYRDMVEDAENVLGPEKTNEEIILDGIDDL